MRNTRREFLGAAGALAALPLLGAQDASKTLTPTEDNIEGPYYRKDAPFRSKLAEGVKGDPLSVSGRVLSAAGIPLGCAEVVIDVWHASAEGEYDNDSPKYLLRGKVAPGRNGLYRFE